MGPGEHVIILDTSFLIDLQREWTRSEDGVATRFLRVHDRDEFAISVISVVEFLEGYEVARDGEEFIAPYQWIDVSPGAARMAAVIRRKLRRSGVTIGDFDVLIGATALELGATVVTANTAHFEAIEHLSVISYR
jgi:tRNA(fMet)-specific endonuclease VapC